MQNLPIANIPAAAQIQASTQQEKGSDQVTEPFGNVLARQRAGAGSTDSKQAAPPAEGEASGGEIQGEVRTPSPETAGDMLAALLPVNNGFKGSTAAAGDKDTPRAQDTAGAAADNAGLLAALQLPAMAMRQEAAPSTIRPGASGGRNGAPPASSLQRYQDDSRALPADGKTEVALANILPVTLEAPIKEAATALSRPAAETPAQNVLPDANALAALPQYGPAPPAASAPAATQSRLNTPVGGDAWSDEFSQTITWMASQHEQTAELHLNPPQLGPLDVVLSVSGDQATALFASPHAAVRNAVEQALPKLREMLADNGIMLGNATVSDQFHGERQGGPGNRQQHGGSGIAKTNEAMPANSRAGLASWPERRQQGMVDTFA